MRPSRKQGHKDEVLLLTSAEAGGVRANLVIQSLLKTVNIFFLLGLNLHFLRRGARKMKMRKKTEMI